MVAQAKITLGPHEPRQLKKNIYFHAIKSGKNFFAFLGGKQKSFCMKLPKSCTWSWVVRVFIFIFPAEFKVSKRQALFSSSDTFSLNKKVLLIFYIFFYMVFVYLNSFSPLIFNPSAARLSSKRTFLFGGGAGELCIKLIPDKSATAKISSVSGRFVLYGIETFFLFIVEVTNFALVFGVRLILEGPAVAILDSCGNILFLTVTLFRSCSAIFLLFLDKNGFQAIHFY